MKSEFSPKNQGALGDRMTNPRKKIWMMVLNEMIFDARVLKSAQSLSQHYEVFLVGIWRRKFELNQAIEKQKWPFKMAWIDLGRTSAAPRNILGHGFRFLKVLHGIRSLGNEFRPDLVHAHEFSSLPIAYAVKKSTGAKLVYDAHELYRDSIGFSPLLKKSLGAMETKLMQKCDAIIACNMPRAEIMFKEYGAPFLPTVVPNMATYAEYSPSQKLQDITNSKSLGISRLILYQGALLPGRGLEILPRALGKLPQEIGFVLMGGGEKAYIESLQDAARNLKVADRFFILPPVLQSQLFTYTCSADVGIVIYQNTCRNNYYCAPNKLYEYAAAGTPMVGANFPTIENFIVKEDVGSLFDPTNPDELAAAILDICENDDRYQRNFQNCLKIAKDYSWETIPERVLHGLYKSLLYPEAPSVGQNSNRSSLRASQ